MGYDSQGIAKRGDWFAVLRPSGRRGCWCFGSKYRAVEHAERAMNASWPQLARRGYRIEAVWISMTPNVAGEAQHTAAPD